MAKLIRVFSNFPLEFAGGGEASAPSIASALGQNHFRVEYVTDSGYRGLTRISTEEAISSYVRDFTYSHQRFVTYRSFLPPQFYRPLPSEATLTSSDLNLLLIDRIPPVQFLFALRRVAAPSILLLHGLSFESVLPPNPISAAYISYLRLARRSFGLLSKAAQVYFQVFTGSQREILLNLGISPNRVYTIPSGIDMTRVPLPKGHENFGVLYLGRIERATKGIDFLLRVLKRVEAEAPADLRVNIIGSGRDAALLNVFAQSPVVSYHGYVNRAQKEAILERSDLAISTSYIEPFSLSTVEALAAGAKVLTTPCNGPQSIVGSLPLLGNVLPYDPDSFATAVMNEYNKWKVSEDRLLSERSSRSTYVRLRFSTVRMEREYLNMVQKVIVDSHAAEKPVSKSGREPR